MGNLVIYFLSASMSAFDMIAHYKKYLLTWLLHLPQLFYLNFRVDTLRNRFEVLTSRIDHLLPKNDIIIQYPDWANLFLGHITQLHTVPIKIKHLNKHLNMAECGPPLLS